MNTYNNQKITDSYKSIHDKAAKQALQSSDWNRHVGQIGKGPVGLEAINSPIEPSVASAIESLRQIKEKLDKNVAVLDEDIKRFQTKRLKLIQDADKIKSAIKSLNFSIIDQVEATIQQAFGDMSAKLSEGTFKDYKDPNYNTQKADADPNSTGLNGELKEELQKAADEQKNSRKPKFISYTSPYFDVPHWAYDVNPRYYYTTVTSTTNK